MIFRFIHHRGLHGLTEDVIILIYSFVLDDSKAIIRDKPSFFNTLVIN